MFVTHRLLCLPLFWEQEWFYLLSEQNGSRRDHANGANQKFRSEPQFFGECKFKLHFLKEVIQCFVRTHGSAYVPVSDREFVKVRKNTSHLNFEFSEPLLDSRFSQAMLRKCADVRRVFPRGSLQGPVFFLSWSVDQIAYIPGQVKVDFLVTLSWWYHIDSHTDRNAS